MKSLEQLGEIITSDVMSGAIPETIYPILRDYAAKRLVLPPLVATYIPPAAIPGSSVNVNSETDSLTFRQTPEGSEFAASYEALSNQEVTPLKYGAQIRITQETIEDVKWFEVERQIRKAGYKAAKLVDSLLATAIEAGATASSQTVTGGSAITVDNINAAVEYVQLADYEATDLIVSPAVARDINNIDTYKEADKAGITNPGQGLIGKIAGMNVHLSNNITANYAYVIDRDNALIYAEKRPLTVAQEKRVTHDTQIIVASMRGAATYDMGGKPMAVITTT